jgi:c-di-GMP-binding flagellar brake protein YcgR
MQSDRRYSARGAVKGMALFYSSQVEATNLIDVGLGGARVWGKALFSCTEPIWVDLTFKQPDQQLIFGKRTKAMLIHSRFDQTNRRYTMGFEFLNLTKFQQQIIASAIVSANSRGESA